MCNKEGERGRSHATYLLSNTHKCQRDHFPAGHKHTHAAYVHSKFNTEDLKTEGNVNKAFWKIHMYFSKALWVAECIHALLTNTH